MEVGGPFMWPIFILAILSLAVVLEKISYYFFISRDLNSKFKIKLTNLLNFGDLDEVVDFCKNYKNPVAKATIKSINHILKEEDEFVFINELLINDEIEKIEKRSWILGMSITAAPQLGLLGTIVGMIKSFGALSDSGDPTMVASGISEALYTTAFGLLVAIPVLVCHVAIGVKNEKLIESLYNLEMLLNRRFKNDKKKKA